MIKYLLPLIILLAPIRTVNADDSLARFNDLMGRGLADRADEWLCDPIRSFSCSLEGCDATEPKVWIKLAFSSSTYSRCDRSGCDTYNMEYSKSGVYTIAELRGRGAFMKATNDGSEYSEVTSSGVGLFQHYGSCKPLG